MNAAATDTVVQQAFHDAFMVGIDNQRSQSCHLPEHDCLQHALTFPLKLSAEHKGAQLPIWFRLFDFVIFKSDNAIVRTVVFDAKPTKLILLRHNVYTLFELESGDGMAIEAEFGKCCGMFDIKSKTAIDGIAYQTGLGYCWDERPSRQIETWSRRECFIGQCVAIPLRRTLT